MFSIALSFIAGNLTTISPCVLPVLPLIVGSAFREHRHGPIAAGAGLAISFTVTGILLARAGSILGFEKSAIQFGASILIILFGVTLLVSPLEKLFGRVLSPMANQSQQILQHSLPAGLIGQFIVGILLGALWSPCAGPTLGVAFSLASESSYGIGKATLIMMSFGVGAALPLVLVAYASRSWLSGKMPFLLQVSHKGKIIYGFLIIAFGVATLSGFDKVVEGSVTNWLPQWWLRLTTLL